MKQVSKEELSILSNVDRNMLLGEAMEIIIDENNYPLDQEEEYINLRNKMKGIQSFKNKFGLNEFIINKEKAFWLEFDEYMINKAYEIKISQGTC